MPSLKEQWQAILDCDCNIRGSWCADCCENFGAIGDALDRIENARLAQAEKETEDGQ